VEAEPMRQCLSTLRSLVVRDEGASLVEYALGLLLIAVVTVAAISLLGEALRDFFLNASSSI
jgi:Flp pilus assembly pilin Flp